MSDHANDLTDATDPVEPSGGAIDTSLVRRLADILKDTDLTEIEVERGELKIRVSRNSPAGGQPLHFAPAPAPAMFAAPPVAAATVAAPTAESQPAAATAPAGDVIKSPMVGTVYLQPQPGAKPFVQVGDRVAAGQTLLVVEAMKTMNPIPAPRAGVIAALLIEDAQPIEFGEPLIIIE
jgi:acetyl-CoA carboxylase biotin carboxyl carrier protein